MEKVVAYFTMKRKNPLDEFGKYMDLIHDYCDKNNYDCDIYYDEVDNRLDLIHRDNLDYLKKKLNDNEYNKVIILSLSNVTRETAYFLDFIKELQKNQCELECIDDNKICLEYFNEINKILENKESEELER